MMPPHCGIKTQIKPAFPKDLKERSLRMVFQPTPFLRPADSPRYIFINNFSAAGGNTAMLLEDAPLQPPLKPDPRSSHVVIVSAKSLSSFRKNVERLLKWTSDHPDTSLASLAYTTAARRAHYQYRIALEAKSMEQIRETLSANAQVPHIPISSSSKPNVAFAFTGQGSHYIGMGKKLFQEVNQFRRNLKDYD
jgi:acyl transferase domain-containing protein